VSSDTKGRSSDNPVPANSGWMESPPDAAHAKVFGPERKLTEGEARSPRKTDDGRPLDVAPGATPSGAALPREQVPVGSAEPLAACRWRCSTEGGWSAMTTTAAGSPAARASARRGRLASLVSHGRTLRRPRTGASAPARPGEPRHGVDGAGPGGAKPKGASGGRPASVLAVATDLPTDQSLEVEGSGPTRRQAAPLAERRSTHRPVTNGEGA
jgi:hypothetical protein